VRNLFHYKYLSADENRGPSSRTQIILISDAGLPSSDARTASTCVRTAFLQVSVASTRARTCHLRGQGYLPLNGYRYSISFHII
jgi:hypothetical protein